MSRTHTEVLVIGAGVIGSSIAYHLARQGRGVLVVERADVAVEPAASWASAGGVRRQGRHGAEARLAAEAIARWPTLEEELEADMGYRQGGNLLLAESEAEAEQLAAHVQRQHALGFSDVRLLDRRETLALVPGLNERVVAGSFSPADGQADPALTTRAFARAAQRHGASYWTKTICTTLLMEGQRVVGARVERGEPQEVQAEQIVLAAGAWSSELMAAMGVQLPIRTRALQMVLSTPATPGSLRPVLSALGRSLSLKQLDDGAFLLGGGWLGLPAADQRSYTLLPQHIEGNWRTACELLPSVGQQTIARAWCGLEAQSFDNIPFIGPLAGWEGLTIALGFSGHGFAISPAVGRAVAAQLAGQPTPELDDLSPARVASFDPDRLAAFLAEGPKAAVLE
jgi:sarcosine oxidase subunit beta